MFKNHKHATTLQKKLKKLSTAKEIFDEVEKEFSFMNKKLDSELKDIVILRVTQIINSVGGIEQKKKEELEMKKKEEQAKKLIPDDDDDQDDDDQDDDDQDDDDQDDDDQDDDDQDDDDQ